MHCRSLRNNSGKVEPLRANLRSSSDGSSSSSGRLRCPPTTSKSKVSKSRGEDTTERLSLPPHAYDIKAETPNTSNHEDFPRCICDADQATSHVGRESSSSSPESQESLYRCAGDSNEDDSDEERDVFFAAGHGSHSPYRSRIPVPVGALGNHIKVTQ